MKLADLSLLVILFCKGCAELLLSGSHWLQRYSGMCSSTSYDYSEVSFYQCVMRCDQSKACKALFYTYETRQCRLRDEITFQSKDLPLQDSPSTVYIEMQNAITPANVNISLPVFQTVLLGNDDMMTFRIVFVPEGTHSFAIADCSQLGGRLIQSFTLARYTFFESLADAMRGDGPYWIDVTNKFATDFEDINQWTTEDGQFIPATFWDDSEPRRPHEKHCVILSSANGNRWRTRECNNPAAYVCEIPT